MSLTEALNSIPNVHVYAKLDWLHSGIGFTWEAYLFILRQVQEISELNNFPFEIVGEMQG